MVTRLMGKSEQERIDILSKPLLQIDPTKISSYEQSILYHSIHITEILTDWIDTFIHTNPHKEDIDTSDSIKFTLTPGASKTITINIPNSYILLLKQFIVSDFVGSSYEFKINSNVYLTGAEFLSQSGMGIPINELSSVSMTITNNSIVTTNEYSSQIVGVYRPKYLWKWPVYTSKSQLYKRLG